MSEGSSASSADEGSLDSEAGSSEAGSSEAGSVADSEGALDERAGPASAELDVSSSADAVADAGDEGVAAGSGPSRSRSVVEVSAAVDDFAVVAASSFAAPSLAVERDVLGAGDGSHGLVPIDEGRVRGRGGARKGLGPGPDFGADDVGVAASLGGLDGLDVSSIGRVVRSSVSTSHSSSLGHPAGDEPEDASEGGRGVP